MGTASLWALLGALVLGALALDLGVHRRQHAPLTLRSAALWSLGWMALAVVYGALVWWQRGAAAGQTFYTAWLLEKSLSFDNLMVFLLLFTRLQVPPGEHHRVLTWGIVGAVGLRAAMLAGGVELLRAWHPIVYVLGGLLTFTGLRTLLGTPHEEVVPSDRGWARWLRRGLPLAPRYQGGRFITVENGRRVGTLLLFALLLVELSDVMFALDSIPAVLAVTTDAQVVFSSNVLAILGLRALYSVVEPLMSRLRYLRVGAGVILVLVGAKMWLQPWVKVPPLLALAATLLVMAATVFASRLHDRARRSQPAPRHALGS